MATIAHWPHRSDQPRRAQKRLVELAQGAAEAREASRSTVGRAVAQTRAAGELEAVAPGTSSTPSSFSSLMQNSSSSVGMSHWM